MSKLKTLKDIMYKDGINIIGVSYEFERLLKQEAIKWVKTIALMDDISNKAIWLWMKFFDITEEELKK